METVLYQNRPEYYQAIEDARHANDSGVFIEFTLSALYDIIVAQEKHQVKHEDKHQVELSDTQIEVLNVLDGKTMWRKNIFYSNRNEQ